MKFLNRIMCALCVACLMACLGACDLPFSKDDPVVVSVGSAKLHLSEIRERVPDWDSLEGSQRLKFLEKWIDDETLYQKALENGADKDSALSLQIEQTVRKMIVDHFLQSFADTMLVGDAEKIDYYRAHPDKYLRGRTLISGALIYFKDWQAADLYYKMHKKVKFDSVPPMHYLVKRIEPFDSLAQSPDSCMIPDINEVELSKLSVMKVCGGALKMSLVVSRLDSLDVLPYEEVAEDVATEAWLEHRSKVMDRLKKEWKTERPIFSQMDVFTEKEQ